MNNKVTRAELEELFSSPAINVDKAYVTLRTNGIRITFAEFCGTDDIKARCGVVMSHESMKDLHETLSNVLGMLAASAQVTKSQDIVENTEEKKDVLQ